MTHQCPKCELRFTWRTELDDHCRTDHPGFEHTYPAVHNHAPGEEFLPVDAPPGRDPFVRD
ncbi:MAG: hypothetical protein ACTHMS_04900 [Jatrophihabitans sp.]|uniref:hypothetical protein n=1 Tax=Jatrophihabitans sp. TaxID=1932789 RepID=UPI003F810428